MQPGTRAAGRTAGRGRQLSRNGRRFVLCTHLVGSLGWWGAAAAYLSLAIAAESSSSGAVVRSAWVTMELIGWSVIVPLSAIAFITGIALAVGTPWGLTRHYWVLIALILTGFSVVVLALHMPTVSTLADTARGASDVEVVALGGDVFHPAVGLAVLTTVTILNVYKPKGVTRRGSAAR